MLRSAWSQIRTHPGRIAAVGLAIVIGVGFAAAAVVFTDTFRAGLAASVSASSSKVDVLVTAPPGDLSPDRTAEKVRGVDGVQHAEPLYSTGTQYAATATHGSLSIDVVPRSERLRWFTLASGHWPSGAGEIVVDASTAESAALPVGAELSLSGFGSDQVSVRVVGIADTSASALAGSRARAFAAPGLFHALGRDAYASIAVLGNGSVPPEVLRAAVASALGDEAEVRTSAEQMDAELAAISGRADVLSVVLPGFAVIAMAVAAIVIANTFSILLTARRRQIALLRCVGAGARQIRRSVLAEAGLLGLLGSVVGVLAGAGVGLLAARLAGFDAAGPVIAMPPLAGIALLGTGVTVLAGWLPALRAMRAAPLVALRPVADDVTVRRTSRLRVAAAVLLLAGGGAGMAGGLVLPSLLIALGGGLVSAVGVLLLTPTFLPPLLRLLGGAGRVAGVPGRLAAGNAIRNTGRAAATSAALLVGVTLIITVAVAAASAAASLDAGIADRYPVDVSVTVDEGALPAELAAAVNAVPGVTTARVFGAEVSAEGIGSDGPGSAGSLSVLGVDDRAASLLRGGTNRLDDGTALVPSWWLGSDLRLGDTITLSAGGHQERFTVAVGRLTDAGPRGSSVVLTLSALQRLTTAPHIVGVWGSVAEDADISAVTAELNRVVGPFPEAAMGGGAAERAAVSDTLGTLITLAIGLLAVAVVIAVVGIGNTLGLSVIERTRESALLRALGLRRSQLRLMLAVEALLLAAVGALAGLGLGLLYGWVGAAATLAEAGRPLVFDVPLGQLLAVVALALIAGLAASVLPARRAASTAPTVALADLG